MNSRRTITHTARPHSQRYAPARALATHKHTRTHATHRNASHRNTNALTSLHASSPPSHPYPCGRRTHAPTAKVYRRNSDAVRPPPIMTSRRRDDRLCVRARGGMSSSSPPRAAAAATTHAARGP